MLRCYLTPMLRCYAINGLFVFTFGRFGRQPPGTDSSRVKDAISYWLEDDPFKAKNDLKYPPLLRRWTLR